MDQSLKSPGQSALDDAFHRLFDLSRAEPAPTLEKRLDRLARLRAVVADNEARFEAAISADFGHRCATETLFAETMFVLGEIKHTAKHLKKWMAPRRVATALQFMPAKNRLIPQPLGVVGIIAPWNYPLQLTLAPAVGAIAAGNRVHDQAERTGAAILRAVERGDLGQIRRQRNGRDRHRGGYREDASRRCRSII